MMMMMEMGLSGSCRFRPLGEFASTSTQLDLHVVRPNQTEFAPTSAFDFSIFNS